MKLLLCYDCYDGMIVMMVWLLWWYECYEGIMRAWYDCHDGMKLSLCYDCYDGMIVMMVWNCHYVMIVMMVWLLWRYDCYEGMVVMMVWLLWRYNESIKKVMQLFPTALCNVTARRHSRLCAHWLMSLVRGGGGVAEEEYVFCVPRKLQRLLSLFCLWEANMLPLFSIMALWVSFLCESKTCLMNGRQKENTKYK